MSQTAFALLLRQSGFTDVVCLGPSGYASSPATMGMTFLARKPAPSRCIPAPLG
ncbi:hypothetical protein DMR_36010 [Solidesulfovibrio magneticus RS-1]|uniref:Uncharacterized protein n=1 Tax=Solidesulfovibrio magneticus (strain ATCC 700980 / DSM 13731 / RS-1) TaxID=573370 RepID=C4XLF3_SOLM1|nr:hypothetical protein [Solidesulfovibrio magneticus]BAH77092.1 hypothetical protein DMR_36010 [Solidesulfovibrio magneticus RS-1]